jgi:MYXO-CTERM domain-containing protein
MSPPVRPFVVAAVTSAVTFAIAGCLDGAGPEPGAARTSRPVIGGQIAQAGEFPATGALVVDFGGGPEPGCTGTLIAPNVVLTAAHCVDPIFLGDEVPGFTLEIDANSLVAADVVAGRSKHMHPEFDLFSEPAPGVGQWYDIGLLILSEDLEGVVPEQLPTPAEAAATLVVDAQVDLVGYGYTDQQAGAYGVKAVGRASLVEVGSHELHISRPGEQQNCNGDSGGPAFLELAGGGRRLFGVVSRSPDDNLICDHGGIDTRVDPYIPWIEETLADEDIGLPVPPDAGPVVPDAGPDTGAGSGADEDGGGCGCRTADPRGAAPSGLLLLLALLARRSVRHRRAGVV